MKLVFILALFAAPLLAQSNGVAGRWQTPTGAVVEVAPCGDDICARILTLDPHPPTRTDDRNSDPALRSRPLCGLRIGSGFHLSDSAHAVGGRLYDPKSGKTYNGTLTAQGDTLHLRGYVGIPLFGRTETWTRFRSEEILPTCQ